MLAGPPPSLRTRRLGSLLWTQNRLSSSLPIVHIPKADVYPFGRHAAPVLRDLDWTVNDAENWAIVSSGSHGKYLLFQLLTGHLKISPYPPDGPVPFLSARSGDYASSIALVSFRQRRNASGAFYDYTARYGAVHEEDRITLRQHMFPETVELLGLASEVREIVQERLRAEGSTSKSEVDVELFNNLAKQMELEPLLDLPLIALSNGQTRRARILKAILTKPQLMLLDEPLTGLDAQHRPKLLNILHELHSARNPRVIIALRTHDPIPDWITHIALVRKDTVLTGIKDEVVRHIDAHSTPQASPSQSFAIQGSTLVEMKDVNVRYGPRPVLKNINWRICQGDRWYLQGANGSGKTTLLSVLMGDHPQSYTQPHLHLFGKRRSRMPTAAIAASIGVLSPEMFDAFPRRAGMSVRDVISTGFDNVFIPPRGFNATGEKLSPSDLRWRESRIDAVLGGLWWKADPMSNFGRIDFVDLSIGEQRMVMLMRALVGQKPLVLLDEAWSGMDEDMIGTARLYLRGDGLSPTQAVVVITHWEEEVPWAEQDGLKRIQLASGEATVRDSSSTRKP